jgi:tRNA U55 pseudouridine synthase TruB
MEKLLRTGSGIFRIDEAMKLCEVEEKMKKGIISEDIIEIDEIFRNILK